MTKPTKTVHGFLIRPKEKDIISVLHNPDDKEIYKIIESGDSGFDVLHIDPTNIVLVDEEGLLKDQRYYFEIAGHPFPVAGRGLVLGTNVEGDTISTNLTLEKLQSMVSFSERKMLGFDVVEGTEEIMGKEGFFIRNTPIFGPPEKDTGES